MCGIAALVAYGAVDTAPLVAEMTRIVRHRGPDDEGYTIFTGTGLEPRALGGDDTPSAVWNSGLAYSPRGRYEPVAARIALGHRRLSIVDLSPAGHQPMCTPDGNLWIVYNGEVYNHVELRAELERIGHAFKTRSDTEVILTAWQAWGKACLDRFNGMFAFVLVDRAARQVVAVRDRFGVKPMYWWRSPQGYIAFASEIKQFTRLPGWHARANPQACYDYLVWGVFDHSAATLFEGVRQLRGGEILVLPTEQGPVRIQPERWYTLSARPPSGNAGGEVAEFRETFVDAVRLRLRADVAVGSCLSGGLDSSSIVCVTHRLLREQGAAAAHKTFSAASLVARYDERTFAQAVIDATAADGHFVYPDPRGALGELECVTWHQDEPFGSSSIYAQWCVFRVAAENGVRVVLDGQGADEQLAGYPGFLGPRLVSLLRSLNLIAFMRELVASGRQPSFGYGYAIGQLANLLLPDALRQRLRARSGRPALAPAWLDFERLGALDREPCGDTRGDATTVAGLSRRLLLDTGLPMLLHSEDRNSMAHSVESRVPFLDYRLVEQVLGMPDSSKLSDGITKRVLRAAMAGILPEVVRIRPDKLGFATAEEHWLRTSEREVFRAAVARCVERADGIVRPAALAEFDAITAGRRPFSFGVWRLVNFGVWLDRFRVELG
ncbi:MAG: asparagine synthase (glutamine-hydrolyzing) [Burkholderiales bacterium]|nr:asparagine synthase (glutamine-hydrolyzing) [Burkholderiales bacterium]